jgi:hypothetical protein
LIGAISGFDERSKGALGLRKRKICRKTNK